MTKLFLYLSLLFVALMPMAGKSQSLPDSLLRKLDTAKSFDREVTTIINNTSLFQLTPAKQLKILFPLLSYFTKKKEVRAIAYIELTISNAYSSFGDLSATVKYGLSALKEFEVLKDTGAIIDTYSLISNAFNGSKNTEQAFAYWRKALAISKAFNNKEYSTILNNMADGFNTIKMPDSALPYAQEAVNFDRKLKDTQGLAASITTLGETYIGLKEYEIAKSFINEGISFSKTLGQNQFLDCGYNDMAQVYFETSQYDSSLLYAYKGLSYAYPDYLIDAIRSYQLIYKNFDKLNRPDSSNRYYRLAMEAKDSLLSDEKKKEIVSMNLQEEERQREIAAVKEEQEKQHKENIENVLIALGIVSVVILFLLLSRTVIANANLIKFLGIGALLLVFEFINLLIHSFLEGITHHSQVLMLLLLAGLAALLIPLHHKIEHWAVHKMVEKNKAARLAAAKRTIEKLEKKEDNTAE